MLKRLLLGLAIGLVVGVAIAAALVKGLSWGVWDGAVVAYLFAALTGAITGMVAGKPIWAKGGGIEAGLKAVFGALLAAGFMFALRQWGGGLHLNLEAIDAKSVGSVGDLPAVSLPFISALLGAIYGLDNTPAEENDKAGAKKLVSAKGAAPAKGKSRVEPAGLDGLAGDDDELEVAAPKKAKR